MKGNFSYDPTRIDEYGLDRMRFELGDTMVEEPEKTAYLCDEEIEAVIKSSSTWKRAQFRLVDSLVRRFAYEVDEHADPASWAWHQRYEQWKKMRDELKSEAEASDSSPLSLADPSKKPKPPYFFENMHANKNFIVRGRR